MNYRLYSVILFLRTFTCVLSYNIVEKNWESVCSLFSCGSSFNQCIQCNCFGQVEIKRILTGHEFGVSSLVVLPNDNLASGSYESTVKIWKF